MIVHFPEGGAALGKDGQLHEHPSVKLPDTYIKGAAGAGDAFTAECFLAGMRISRWPTGCATGSARQRPIWPMKPAPAACSRSTAYSKSARATGSAVRSVYVKLQSFSPQRRRGIGEGRRGTFLMHHLCGIPRPLPLRGFPSLRHQARRKSNTSRRPFGSLETRSRRAFLISTFSPWGMIGPSITCMAPPLSLTSHQRS